jgi:MFS family permease
MLEYPRRSYGWLVVAILIATAILSFTDRQVLSLLVDPIRGDLHLSDTQMSLLLGIAFAFVYGTAGIPLGILADRISRRNLIVAGVVVWSTGTIACGLSHSFHELFLSRIIVGLGEGVLAPAAISLISDYFPPERRGTAVALFLSGIAMGSGAAILIGGAVLHVIETNASTTSFLTAYAPWRMVLLLIGAPGFLWALVVFTIREPKRRSDEELSTVAAPALAASEPRAVRSLVSRLAPLYISIAAASLVDNAVGAWAPSLLIRDFAKDPAQIGLQLGGWLTLGFGAGVLLGGYLADRTVLHGGWKRKLQTSFIFSLLILPASLLIHASGFAWVMTAVPLYFALSGIVTAVGFSAILDCVPSRSRGFAMSIAFFLNVAIGAGVGPTAVAFFSRYLFNAESSLGLPIMLTVIVGYGIGLAALGFALIGMKSKGRHCAKS